MASNKMWAGRSESATAKIADDFNSSIHFDCRMYKHDITGSMIHAQMLAKQGIAVRAGLPCAPLAHESAGTLDTGTVRLSFGWDAEKSQTGAFLQAASKLLGGKQEIF